MNSPILLNPNDFEYLTPSDKEYLYYIQRLYLLNSGKLKSFHVLGPWHQVPSRQLNKIIERVAAPNPRPCSRGHVKGLWCVEDPDYITGPKILKYQGSVVTPPRSGLSSASGTPRKIRTPRTEVNKYSIPRKYQVVPKPTPWIIMEPSKKKNFITDDPPDPSYRDQSPPRSAKTQRSATQSRPSTGLSSLRYITSQYSTSVSAEELSAIVERVTKPTHASKGGVDLQEKYRNKDYVYGSKPCTPNLRRISAPTVSSKGGKDIAEKFANKDYVYGSRPASAEYVDQIVNRVTRPTVASSGGAGVDRQYTDFVYGDQKVSKEDLDGIIERMTKPTVSSRGGVDLKDKNFVYIQKPKVKTNIIIPGLDKKFMGRKKISQDEMNEVIDRLTKLTPAYKAKFAVNPHVWKDNSARTGPAHQRENQMVAT